MAVVSWRFGLQKGRGFLLSINGIEVFAVWRSTTIILRSVSQATDVQSFSIV
jgi:hypothetical protein